MPDLPAPLAAALAHRADANGRDPQTEALILIAVALLEDGGDLPRELREALADWIEAPHTMTER